jgi:hypothetical protein
MNDQPKPGAATLKLRDHILRTHLEVCPPSDRDQEEGA